jgi:hypothetical protein
MTVERDGRQKVLTPRRCPPSPREARIAMTRCACSIGAPRDHVRARHRRCMILKAARAATLLVHESLVAAPLSRIVCNQGGEGEVAASATGYNAYRAAGHGRRLQCGRGGVILAARRQIESESGFSLFALCRARGAALCPIKVTTHTWRGSCRNLSDSFGFSSRLILQGDRPMVPSEVFLLHAAECEYMAEFSSDPVNREVWRRMAARWIRCAEMVRQQDPQQGGRKIKLHRKPAHWAH